MMKRFMVGRLGKRLHRGQKGFTLIELLIVIAILGVLAALVVPNVVRFMKSGQLASAKQEYGTIQTAVDAAMAEQGWILIDGTDWIGPGDPTTESWTIGDGNSLDTADVTGFLRRDLQGDFMPGADGEIVAAYFPGDALHGGAGAIWSYTKAGGWVEE